MDKTPFSKRVEILHDFYMDYSGSEEYDEFISLNDLGFPAAILLYTDAATLTDKGMTHVNDTWNAFCELLEVDSYGEYDNLDSLMEFANE